ncbi:uncharacterized protein LOC129720028 [Wyeomyia smithii]|uniref:uncharacterized protein LOC129720028 n=1 Tax=Wyeomyia smithii TaxID=174621 RepID=UPI002467D8BA|nr:uncharacterized protein LOC129720028 [Wyeomyia smithii]
MLELTERQTASYIREKINYILLEYNITFEQVLTVTCDNGANIVAAVRQLDEYVETLKNENYILEDDDGDDDEDDEEMFNDIGNLAPNISLVRCSVHTLQLAVTDVIKYSDIRIRSITAVAKSCRKASYKPSFDLGKVPLPPLYAKTRWGCIYEMILNFYSNENFYRDLGKKFKELDLSKYWDYIRDYRNALHPIYVCTKEMQAKHMPLSEFYVRWLQCMMEVDQQPTNELAESLAASLNVRLQQLQQNLPFKAAVLIDPRLNYLSSSVLSPEEKQEARKFLTDIHERLKSLKPHSSQEASAIVSPSTSSLDDYMTKIFGGALPSSSQSTSENSLAKQIVSLDLEPHQHHKYDIWKHWTDRKVSNPEGIAEAALCVLSVPAIQVSVERGFSGLALVLSEARTKLSVENLSNILVIKLNEELLDSVMPKMYDWKEYRA